MNDYIFWEKYLNDIRKRIDKLIQEQKDVTIDLHLHSTHSTDGAQTLKEIIEIARKNRFDLISITDHDTVAVYDELFNYLKDNKLDDLIIIPGVEFTVENEEYGGQCHILQYMINPKSEEIKNDVKKSLDSYYTRTNIQFKRLEQNEALQKILKENNIQISKKEYFRYLDKLHNPIPDYASLTAYITNKLLEKNVTVLDVFDALEQTNKHDLCKERRLMKTKRYKVLREKYKDREDAYKSPRLLLSIMGVKGVDDDYFKEYEPCGSISVNSYGQLRIEDLNNKNITVFAHPTESRIDLLDKLIKLNNAFVGLEDNSRNIYEIKDKLLNKAKQLNFIITKGSDRHKDDNLYDDMSFYKIKSKDFKKMMGVFYGKH